MTLEDRGRVFWLSQLPPHDGEAASSIRSSILNDDSARSDHSRPAPPRKRLKLDHAAASAGSRCNSARGHDGASEDNDVVCDGGGDHAHPDDAIAAVSTSPGNQNGFRAAAKDDSVEQVELDDANPAADAERLRIELKRLQTKQKVVNHHIKCLHAYNEIKDIAQGLFGKLAEIRGLRTRDVYEDFDVELQD